jgi:hypothetical protein
MELKQHPLSAAFPAMSADDFQALKDDIENNGQREPVMVLDDMVIDGWHRYSACIQLGLKPLQVTFDPEDDPVAFVLSQNLHRRHLSASQRAAAVVACTHWTPPNIGRPRVEAASTLAQTNAEMAKIAQVTPRTITDAKTAHKAGLGDAVKAGAITVEKAAQIARGTPAKAPALAAVPAPDRSDELAESGHVIAELSEENETLRAQIAVGQMDAPEVERINAAELIAELRGQVKALNAELDAMRVSRDILQRENRELMTQVGMNQRELKRLRAA